MGGTEMKKISLLVMAMVLAAAMLLMTACGGPKAADIPGDYEVFAVGLGDSLIDTRGIMTGMTSMMTLHFNEDGTGSEGVDPYGFTWELKGDKLELNFSDGTVLCPYKNGVIEYKPLENDAIDEFTAELARELGLASSACYFAKAGADLSGYKLKSMEEAAIEVGMGFLGDSLGIPSDPSTVAVLDSVAGLLGMY